MWICYVHMIGYYIYIWYGTICTYDMVLYVYMIGYITYMMMAYQVRDDGKSFYKFVFSWNHLSDFALLNYYTCQNSARRTGRLDSPYQNAWQPHQNAWPQGGNNGQYSSLPCFSANQTGPDAPSGFEGSNGIKPSPPCFSAMQKYIFFLNHQSFYFFFHKFRPGSSLLYTAIGVFMPMLMCGLTLL